MADVSTIPSGRAAAIRSLGGGRVRGLVDLDVDGLEGRPQQRTKCVVVVNQQEARPTSFGAA